MRGQSAACPLDWHTPTPNLTHSPPTRPFRLWPTPTHSYVSRVSRSSNIDHLVLGTTQYKPAEFAERMLNLKLANMWGVVKWICDRFLAGGSDLEPGTWPAGLVVVVSAGTRAVCFLDPRLVL